MAQAKESRNAPNAASVSSQPGNAASLNEQALAGNNSSDAVVNTAPSPLEESETQVNSAMVALRPFGSAIALKSNVGSDVATIDAPVVNEANREDETLVRRVSAGDTEAFAQIVDRYKVAVYNLCARMLHDPVEAEDAAQEIFLRVYNQIKTYTPGRRFSTWILSIASHYCIDVLRRRRPTTDLDAIAFWKASDRPEPEENAITLETRDEVRDLLNKLPEKYRSVTVLRYWQDLSYDEIAQATGLSVPTVKTRLFRARELLAKEIEKERRNGNDMGRREAAVGKPRTAKAKVRGSQNVLP